eukprot:TRINITY_DN16846_c0_g1_i1.p1 TRINITY_DN16846_c0_g1~~TRINITY_DN16846_c0_g1_i1.p1  ORF type:complete len:234 (+),score=66.86 TRINITY_DN16846_c0_g1_i1:24-704(+)
MGGKKRVFVPSDVVVVEDVGRDAAARLCEGCSIEWSSRHGLALGRTGTILTIDGPVAVVDIGGSDRRDKIKWPVAGLLPSASLPPRLASKGLLSQVKLRKGKALKSLQEELLHRPGLVTHWQAHSRVERDNERQRVKLMWATDAKSKVRTCNNRASYLFKYTDPMATGTVPRFQCPPKPAVHDKFSLTWEVQKAAPMASYLPPLQVDRLEVPSTALTRGPRRPTTI